MGKCIDFQSHFYKRMCHDQHLRDLRNKLLRFACLFETEHVYEQVRGGRKYRVENLQSRYLL